jgi:hypothetical protein
VENDEDIIGDSILNFNFCFFFNKELYIEMKNFIPITNIINERTKRTTKLGKNISNEQNDIEINEIIGFSIENTLLYCKIKYKNWVGWMKYSIYKEKKEYQINKFLKDFEIFLKSRVDPIKPIKKIIQIELTDCCEYQYFYNKGKTSKNKYATNTPHKR